MWFPSKTTQPMGVKTLVFAIEQAITDGQLKVGDRLPPQRILAYRLDINPTTVSRAYKQAAQQGLVGGQIGRGTYVLGRSNAAMFAQAISSKSANIINLSLNMLDCDDKLLKINKQIESANVIAKSPQYYEYISNDLLVRYQLAVSQWLSQCRDIAFDSQDILAIPSCQYGLQFLLSKLLNKGDVILVDEFTAPGIITSAKQCGLRLFSCKGDEQGITPEALNSAIIQTNARAFVTIPSHHSPMAFTQTEARRKALAQVINQHQLLVLEEDIYGAFNTPPPLSKYIKQHSYLISGFSKFLSGGHRASFIASQHASLNILRENIVETAWLVSSSAVSHIITAIEHQFIDQALAHVIKQTRLKNKMLNTVLKTNFNETSPHHWVNCDEFDLSQGAALGLSLSDASNFSIDGRCDPGHQYYRLSVLGVPMAELAQGAAIIAALRRDNG